jgi:hypothetical protein
MTLYNGPKILPVREQARVVNDLLRQRFDILLPAIMRETGFDMWIIVCNEDLYDPVFSTMIPWECWAPILQMVVYYDNGESVERINISLTHMNGLMTDTWNLDSPVDQWTRLRQIVEERKPRRIGINQSDVIWAADGLTVSLKARLVAALDETLAARLESAEPMCIRWLETRLPQELDLYHHACGIAHWLMKRAFSREVTTPGVTTSEDLRWWYWQQATDLGLPLLFPAFYRFARSPQSKARWDEQDRVIRPGDLLHCDVGVKYLRLLTDHQEMAYVLHPSETDAPQGLRDALKHGNHLQDVFTGTWQEGLTGNEILKRALATAREAGIPKPKIYSHSLSHYLHEPGPLMGLPWEQGNIPGRGDVMMHYDTVYTVELSVTCPIPEWDNQEVTIALEQDAAFTRDGVVYLDGRQTAFHLI